MRTRQNFLTATDVKELLPYTATGRPRKIGDEQYLKVYGRKLKEIYPDDCISTGMAARGHLLEPYAIGKLNEVSPFEFYWWDDFVVGTHTNGLAFSPDAMTVPMPEKISTSRDAFCRCKDISVHPYHIAEVKSYSSERHYLCGNTDPHKLEERWQIATAMATDVNIFSGTIVFFNPSVVNYMFYHTYNRSDLDDEIQDVLGVLDSWLDWKARHLASSTFAMSNLFASPFEDKIIANIEEAERLNP